MIVISEFFERTEGAGVVFGACYSQFLCFARRYYNFTEFACQLNEVEPGVSPSDSRQRPDQRLMEDGNWDVSNQEKLR